MLGLECAEWTLISVGQCSFKNVKSVPFVEEISQNEKCSDARKNGRLRGWLKAQVRIFKSKLVTFFSNHAAAIKELVESWFETRLKVDHQVRARIMANLGENEILAQFLSIIFSICTLCIIYGQKSRCWDLLFGRRERETTVWNNLHSQYKMKF